MIKPQATAGQPLALDTWPCSAGQLAAYRAQITAAVQAHPDRRGVVVLAPTVDWSVHAFQRPHQLALAFARRGYVVFFALHHYSLDAPKGVRRVAERLYLCRVPGEALSVVERPVCVVLPYNARFIRHLREPLTIYDYLDDLEVFPYDPVLLADNHAELLATADVVVPTARRLEAEVRPQRPDAVLAPNAVAFEDFAAARAPGTPPPGDLRPLLELGRPLIGYYGVLAAWVDWDMLLALAEQRADLTFVFLGIDQGQHTLTEAVFGQPNVHYLGSRPYAALPPYLRFFDVALIPFRVNTITLATSPLKLFEYLAGRKPVVSTPLPECEAYPEVLIAADAAGFSAAIDRALDMRADPHCLDQLEAVALANTWDARVEALAAAVVRAPTLPEFAERRARLPALQARWQAAEKLRAGSQPLGGWARRLRRRLGGLRRAVRERLPYPVERWLMPRLDRLRASAAALHVGPRFKAAVLNYRAPLRAHPMYSVWLTYSLTTNERGQAVVERVRPLLGRVGRGQRMLDIGCAYGGTCLAFASAGVQAVGLELSPTLLTLARANLADHPGLSVELLQRDVTEPDSLADLGRFDLITCDSVIEHVLDVPALLRHMADALHPRGLCHLVIPNAWSCAEITRDGHYGWFGLSLLPRERALAYYHATGAADPYDVGHFHTFAEYERLFAAAGLSLVLLDPPDGADEAAVLRLEAQLEELPARLAHARAEGQVAAGFEAEVAQALEAHLAAARGAFQRWRAAHGAERHGLGLQLQRDYARPLWLVVSRPNNRQR